MKHRILLIIIVLITLSFSCGKSPTGPENTAPVLSGIDNQTVTAGQTENVALSATDTDGNSLALSIPTNPGFLSITGFSQVGDTATATLVIAPDETIAGTFNATVRVSDGQGGADNESFTIEVVASYSLSDIVGTWTGEASNSNNFSLNLTVDAEGEVSGIGAGGSLEFSAEWSVDDEGKVTGSGVIFISSGGTLTIEMGYWSLQLSADKTSLSGSFSSFSLGSMDVNLNKQ